MLLNPKESGQRVVDLPTHLDKVVGANQYQLSPEPVPLQSFFVEKAKFLGKDNAAMVCESVASLMHSNKIGIDVDEGFRIIIFDPKIKEEQRKELDLILDLSFLSQDQGMVDMLRQHFRWCLLVYFLSGKEVADIFPLAYLADIMAAMGSEPEEVEGLRHQKAADWDTPTGKEVWALLEERYAMDNHT
ncbi:hypothetical protein OF83DRAFT_1082756 [Amylostereum chailletii]|nr:hypothetical protein OF83DRAFT_1082756 [Amylostereum chailletii]